MKHPTHGFTLLEVVVVVALISGILAIGSVIARPAQQQQHLKIATATVISDLEGARSNAVRYSQNSSFTLMSSQTSYTVTKGSTTVNRTVPYGAKVVFCQDATCSTTGTGSITYTSPNAEVAAGNYALKITLGDLSTYLKIIGLTGKVVPSAQL